MKRAVYFFFFAVSFLIISSCIDDTYYEESKNCEILELSIKGQINSNIVSVANSDTGWVYVSVNVGTDLSNLEVNTVRLSSLAKCETNIYAFRNFVNDVCFKITAENDKISKIWCVRVLYGNAPKQLPFSNMKQWTVAKYDNIPVCLSDGVTYAYFPGNGTDFSPWQHAAKANELTGSFNVNPKPSASNANYASMETKLSGFASYKLVSGAIYTGIFRFNLAETSTPRKMIDMGTPFFYKPQSVKFKIRYKAGEVMKDGRGDNIEENDSQGRPNKDSCDVYVLLQNRSSNDIWYRVGCAWLRTGEDIGSFEDENGFVEITLPIIYGKPSEYELNSKPYMAIGGIRGEVVFYRFEPNGNDFNKLLVQEDYGNAEMNVDHVIVTFSSSAYGDMFWGAPGSRLDVKDIEFVY
ncbi:MAG: PCMD domain-containing protein [Bacteroidales bacterium]|jgi:hypothetical protein|nr:PCMD domain-containing protein [Bacteroidales bacterium]